MIIRFIVYSVLSILFAYCGAMILIGFPCSIWKAITKKKVNDDIQDKIIKIATIFLSIILILRLIYEFW